jgi:hypothetical protein
MRGHSDYSTEEISHQQVSRSHVITFFNRFLRLVHRNILGCLWISVLWYCRVIQTWGSRWGRAGQNLSILDLTPEATQALMPKDFKDAGLGDVSAVVDGKDFMTETPRADGAITRASYSKKAWGKGLRLVPCRSLRFPSQ